MKKTIRYTHLEDFTINNKRDDLTAFDLAELYKKTKNENGEIDGEKLLEVLYDTYKLGYLTGHKRAHPKNETGLSHTTEGKYEIRL